MVRPQYEHPSPTIEQRERLSPGLHVASLPGLVLMQLLSNRDQDRVHLRDMIDVGLVDREMHDRIPADVAPRLDALLRESGR